MTSGRSSPLPDFDRNVHGQIVRGGIGTFVLRSANTALLLAVSIVLARTLAPEGYGTYALALSLATLLAVPAQLGLPTLVVREIARYQLDESWGLIRGLLARANQGVVLLSFPLVLATGLTAFSFFRFEQPGQLHTLIWALALVPLMALNEVRSAALRGLRRVVQGQFPELVLVPVLLLIFTGVTTMFGSLSPSTAMSLHVLAVTCAFVTGSILLAQALPSEVKRTAPVYNSRVWAKSTAVLSVVLGLQVITAQIGIVLLGLFSGSEDVGVYRVAFQGSGLVAFTLNAMGIAFAPHIARFYRAEDMDGLQRLVTIAARIIVLATLPIAGALTLFGEHILEFVFGAPYAVGHRALTILCLGQFIHAAGGFAGFLLNMTGHERDTANAVGLAAALCIAANLLLIPSMGMNGAAWSSTITYAASSFILWRAVRRRLGIDSSALGMAIGRPRISKSDR